MRDEKLIGAPSTTNHIAEFPRRKDPPHWEQLIWELEAEYGTVTNVPEDDPRLAEIRSEMGVHKSESESVKTDYDNLVWMLHTQGLSMNRIVSMVDLGRNTVSGIVNRLKFQKQDKNDYVQEAIVRYTRQGKSALEIADILGYSHKTIQKYKWQVKRATGKNAGREVAK